MCHGDDFVFMWATAHLQATADGMGKKFKVKIAVAGPESSDSPGARECSHSWRMLDALVARMWVGTGFAPAASQILSVGSGLATVGQGSHTC